MNKKLSKDEVLKLIKIWNNWMNGPDPANNKPREYKILDSYPSGGLKITFGLALHIFLWVITKFSLKTGLNSLAIWASKNRIKYDQIWYEPYSCGLTSSFTDLGIGYLESGKMNKAIECLDLAWRVYPCPHNTSYGIKLKLYKKLREVTAARSVITEYREMWYKFKRA